MLKVLGYSASINVRKVLWTCDEIGVPYTQEEWGGSRSTRGPEFLALNPNAQVPVIQDGRRTAARTRIPPPPWQEALWRCGCATTATDVT